MIIGRHYSLTAGSKVGVLMGLAAVVAVAVASAAQKRANQAGSRASSTSATVAVGDRPAVTARHLGGRVWMTPEVAPDGTSAGMVRVALTDSGALLVTVQLVGTEEVTVRQVWAGNGRYEGEVVDGRTGSRSKVVVSVTVPPVWD